MFWIGCLPEGFESQVRWIEVWVASRVAEGRGGEEELFGTGSDGN